MAAHVLRLRIAQGFADFRAPRTAQTVVALVVGIAAAALGVWGAFALGGADGGVIRVGLVSAGSVIALAFFAAPFASPRADPLDPRAFAGLPVTAPAVAASTALASPLSGPILGLAVVDVAAATVAVSRGTGPGFAVAGVVLHLVTCALAARFGFASAAGVRASGRSGEAAVLAGLVVVAVAVPAVAYALSAEWAGGAPALAQGVADVLASTPLGAAAAVVAPAGGSVWPLVVAIATVALLAGAWALVVDRELRTAPPAPAAQSARLGWFGLLPRTATGAIAARSVIYWATDVRYLANIAIIPIAGLLPVIPLLIAGVPPQAAALVPLPIIAAFLGWSVHNDLAHDAEAVWLHIVTSVRGIADRAGRLVPAALLAVPMLSATIALTAAFADAWDHLPALIGVALCLTLSGFGLSSISSAAWPYAVARPGDSPFRQPQRTGPAAVIVPGAVLVATVAVSMPAVIPAFQAILGGAPRDVEALATGGAIGVGVLVAGVLIGAAVFQLGGHRLLAAGGRV